jgi:hypothetical protein
MALTRAPAFDKAMTTRAGIPNQVVVASKTLACTEPLLWKLSYNKEVSTLPLSCTDGAVTVWRKHDNFEDNETEFM